MPTVLKLDEELILGRFATSTRVKLSVEYLFYIVLLCVPNLIHILSHLQPELGFIVWCGLLRSCPVQLDGLVHVCWLIFISHNLLFVLRVRHLFTVKFTLVSLHYFLLFNVFSWLLSFHQVIFHSIEVEHNIRIHPLFFG